MTSIPELDFAEGKGPRRYWKLVGALENLLRDDPQSMQLQALREEADAEGRTRPVDITQTSVAIEAGGEYMRRLISGEKCAFPKLAAYIVSLRSTHAVSENTTARLTRQASEIAALEQKVRVLRSNALVLIDAKEKAETRLQDAEDQISRLKKRLSG